MTGNDLLKVALDLIFEEGDEYNRNAVSFINLMLPELFDTENGIRKARGEEELSEVPYVAGLSDSLQYCDDLVRGVMPYGLASMILMDDDTGKAGYFRSLYVNAANSLMETSPDRVVDVYE